MHEKKIFEPLDDLYQLLDKITDYLQFGIETKDYIIGRQQLFFIFLHETLHAFIGKAANWIYELSEEETDFIDEVAVRILIDDYLVRFDVFQKVKEYYDNHVDHRNELSLYGFNLDSSQYDIIEKEYYLNFASNKDINNFCRFIHKKYEEFHINRRKDFSYKKIKGKWLTTAST